MMSHDAVRAAAVQGQIWFWLRFAYVHIGFVFSKRGHGVEAPRHQGTKAPRHQGIEASRHKGKTDVQGGCGWKMGNVSQARQLLDVAFGFVLHICPAEGDIPRLVALARDDTRVDVEGCRLGLLFRKGIKGSRHQGTEGGQAPGEVADGRWVTIRRHGNFSISLLALFFQKGIEAPRYLRRMFGHRGHRVRRERVRLGGCPL